MTTALFLSIVAIHLAAAISPGPSFVVSLRVAAAEGFGVASALALGFGLGAVLWAIAAMGGLALVFEFLPQLFTALKIVGGLFLLYIALMMWRHAKEPISQPDTTSAPRSAWRAIRFGFLTFATNPKPAIFFGAVFMGLVPPDTSLGWKAGIILAVFLNETLWYLFVARVFSLARARAAYTRFKAWVDRTFGTLIALFGLKIALT
ncbi:Threonine/homoserine/homoserine lactone efflux protein [Cognatiyoonia koreensis]|uniref:Threonine/homoserine/homoserine lactone efflux protein n=1 Tax=Cognatiyoonia koreensis TaxID=364200 RepID=A0A1I0PJR4_9RHOB|nr:LysE family transporter [Cognatiyoonia koreensis]SEW14609.1 Threonine/homoserine/homoserine lactone efflux protein [Cognatiyoonia koreensis]